MSDIVGLPLAAFMDVSFQLGHLVIPDLKLAATAALCVKPDLNPIASGFIGQFLDFADAALKVSDRCFGCRIHVAVLSFLWSVTPDHYIQDLKKGESWLDTKRGNRG